MGEVGVNSPEEFSDESKQKEIINKFGQTIEAYSFMMKRSLDNGDLDAAFDHAATLVEPLCTGLLTPKNYYDIYHQISTNLLQMSLALADKDRITDRQIAEHYETVQYHVVCLQRLYLMITIGPEMANRGICRLIDILEDLSEMVKSAQDPIRALFVRHYFLQCFKNLPDQTDTETERSLHFLLNNFAQMNRMWVRIADIMATDERREQRQDLSVLIGMNIQRMSLIHGISAVNYGTIILPYISRHVELCEDDMAQEFILQSIVHCFPEDYHISTIDQLFAVFGRVEQGVHILTIVNQLLERFLNYVGNLVDATQSKSIFVTIAKNIEELFNAEGHLALTDKFETLERLLKFALKINPDDVKNVKNLMKFTDFHIDLAIGEESLTQADSSNRLRLFIEVPLRSFKDGASLYELDFLPVLIKRLLPQDRVQIAKIICELFISSSAKIASHENLIFILSLTSSLVREGPGLSCFFSMFHLIDAGEILETLDIIKEIAEAMGAGTPEATERAILPLAFAAMNLMYDASDEELAKIIQFLVVYGNNSKETSPTNALMLFAEASKMCDSLNQEEKAAALAEMAVDLWEDINGAEGETTKYSTAQKYKLLNYLIQFVVSSRFADESLNTQLCNYAGTFTETMRTVNLLCNCSALFWRQDGRVTDGPTVQKCLSMASKSAASSTEQGLVLQGLYTVLSWTAFMLEKRVPLEERWVNALVGIIADKHQEILQKGLAIDNIVPKNIKTFYINTARYIQQKNLIQDDAEEDGDEGEAE